MGIAALWRDMTLPKADPATAALYDACVAAARQPAFYARCGVPDSVDGRFDLVLLHVLLVMRRLTDAGARQRLFDTMFADMERALGDPVLADRYAKRAAHVRSGLYSECWNAARGLLADNPDQKVFSQQANILGVLYDVIPKAQQKDVLRNLFSIQPGETPDGILSASYYFRFYLARALDHAGMGDDYLQSLAAWRQLLSLHFSTWPEQPGDTRSDSHAWSAHPIYDLLTLVAGIAPAVPGFASVRITPHLGSLTSLTASFPHPKGIIQVTYERRGKAFDATITLPAGLSGTLELDGTTRQLKPGVNHIHLP